MQPLIFADGHDYFPVNYSQKKMTHDITTPVMRVGG
jgi:hypothetical protein